MSVGDVNTRAEFDAVSTEKNYECVERFGDMFLFLDFCIEHHLTQENSVTYWSEATQKMYIAF